jgi:hypothetical protein
VKEKTKKSIENRKQRRQQEAKREGYRLAAADYIYIYYIYISRNKMETIIKRR